jgi:DNA-directed RNA polymerase specialized sigma24 family protein
MTLALPIMLHARITAMLSDPDLVGSIRSTLLRKGVPEREVPDMIQESFMAAFRCRNLPDDDAAARRYLFGIVRMKAKKLLRDWHDRHHEPFEEVEMEGSDPAPFEVRDLLRRIAAAVPEKRWQSFVWFTRVAFGDSLADIARDEGVDYATAHARYARMSVDLRRWATQIAAGVAVLLLALGAYRLFHPRPNEVAHPHPTPAVEPPSRQWP